MSDERSQTSLLILYPMLCRMPNLSPVLHGSAHASPYCSSPLLQGWDLVIADLFVRISCSSAFREACAAVRQAAVSVRRCTRLRKPNLKIRSWRLSACFLVHMPKGNPA